jgi:hypothetical protein
MVSRMAISPGARNKENNASTKTEDDGLLVRFCTLCFDVTFYVFKTLIGRLRHSLVNVNTKR